MTTINANAQSSLNYESGGYSLPILLEITHGVAGYDNPLRIVNNNVDLDYGGNTYLAFPFTYDPPDQKEDGTITSARLTISAVDQSISAILRSTATPPTVVARAMYWSDESGAIQFTELVNWALTLRNVTGNVQNISGELVFDDRLESQFPALEFTPTNTPGIF
jgi:hypothetical protein